MKVASYGMHSKNELFQLWIGLRIIICMISNRCHFESLYDWAARPPGCKDVMLANQTSFNHHQIWYVLLAGGLGGYLLFLQSTKYEYSSYFMGMVKQFVNYHYHSTQVCSNSDCLAQPRLTVCKNGFKIFNQKFMNLFLAQYRKKNVLSIAHA